MDGGMSDHVMSDAAALCLALGGAVATVGVAVAVGRLLRRPLSPVVPPLAPTPPAVAPRPGFLIRAGPPPPALLQVFRR
jgi:hypothetical protein